MRRKFIIAIGAISCCLSASVFASCQRANLSLSKVSNGRVLVEACPDDEGGGTITLTVLVGAEKRAWTRTVYADSAYQLSLDSLIDFDNGISQGLGVTTGEGRDANGMHYWKISKDGRSITDLGSAPLLAKDRFMQGYFSGLTSSSGEFQAIRYFYRVKGERLDLHRAIGFKWNDDSTGIAVSMEIQSEEAMNAIRERALSNTEIEQCQRGSINCW
ncbi:MULTISPECIES: hypothetical protein [unclassified Caballeronia]|uniref:hypothetical protein n=1 Tax=unclassified Caballeronia TaxID=2646786 RepID=UPI00202928DE|nr:MULTISPECIES: hypothetical protein [unclassified Caballeronia]MDR5765937.1 hypothetical protein [Caballeronia sp. LZ028]